MAWGKAKSERSSDELRQSNDVCKENSSGHKLQEYFYNKVIDRYTRNGREFVTSDQFVWKGTFFVIPEFIGYMIFFAIFLLLAKIGFSKYGEARTVVFFMLLIMWRLNMQLKQLSQINKKL